jgi:ferritin-like metal-binding protein YciE
MSQRTTFEGALLHSVTTLFDAEKQLVNALPKMADRATCPELRQALQRQVDETRNHVSRIELVFAILDADPAATRCGGIAGILKDGLHALEGQASPSVRDACIIATAQRAKYFESAAYSSAITWAEALDLPAVSHLLQETLREEAAAAERLIPLAHAAVGLAVGDTVETMAHERLVPLFITPAIEAART